MRLNQTLPTALLLGLVAGLAVGALLLARATLESFVGYRPPALAPLQPAAPREALSSRVVLVVVDGLRYDASLEMPFLNELRRRGADFIAETSQPSLSYPGWATLGTGAGPEASGVTTNWHAGPILVDSVLATVRRAGGRTAIVGAGGWGRLYAGAVDVGRYSYDPTTESPGGDRVVPGPRGSWDRVGVARVDEGLAREAASLLAADAPDLLILHFLGPDEAAHAHGAASPEYRQSIAHADDLLRQVATGLDLASTTLVVTSDHGQTDRGGHGGWEPEVTRTPLVLAGRGIARPRQPGRAPVQVDQRDVAPTLAVLLGTALPAQSEGEPLFQALALSPEARARRAVEAAAQRRSLLLAYSRQVGVEPPVDDLVVSAAYALDTRRYAQAAADADGALAELGRALARAREERLERDRLARAPVGAVALVAPLACALALRPRRETLLAVPFAVLYCLAFWALYFGRGYFLSPAAFDAETSVRAFFVARAADAGAIALALAGLVGLAYHRAGPAAVARLWARSVFWVAALLVWQVALFYVLFGVTYDAYLPDLLLALKFFLDLVQLVGLGLAAVPAGLAAILLGERLRALATEPAGARDRQISG